MKSYFKYPINVVIFVLFLVSTLCPLASFAGDAIAYCTGYHHGFQQPWPTIQTVLNWAFPVMLVAFIVSLIVYFSLKASKKIA